MCLFDKKIPKALGNANLTEIAYQIILKQNNGLNVASILGREAHLFRNSGVGAAITAPPTKQMMLEVDAARKPRRHSTAQTACRF